jgi:pSer/pThr/pTyr-binding forkhead associated (FHA) protein
LGGLEFGGLKIAFLVVLWLFILLITNVIRTDVFARPALLENSAENSGGPNPKRRGKQANKVGELRVIAGPGMGDAVPLSGEIVLGRAADATMDLSDDFASGHHARMYTDDKGWIIADLGSTNGTYINGVKIVRPTRVGPQDVIRIGRTQLRLEP